MAAVVRRLHQSEWQQFKGSAVHCSGSVQTWAPAKAADPPDRQDPPDQFAEPLAGQDCHNCSPIPIISHDDHTAPHATAAGLQHQQSGRRARLTKVHAPAKELRPQRRQ